MLTGCGQYISTIPNRHFVWTLRLASAVMLSNQHVSLRWLAYARLRLYHKLQHQNTSSLFGLASIDALASNDGVNYTNTYEVKGMIGCTVQGPKRRQSRRAP